MAALWALVVVAYSNSFQSGFVFDNAGLIVQDPRIREATPQNISSIWSGGYWYVNNSTGLYRPLTTMSYLLNYAVFSDALNPAGYHWVNLVLHAVNVALVYALGVAILGQSPLAFTMAAIWSMHPVLTESVTNIVGRADLLAAFGVLAGLLCYLKSVAIKWGTPPGLPRTDQEVRPTGWRRLAWLAGLTASQTVGLLSKESAVVLPGLMLLYDLTWPERATWRRRVPAYAALALPFALFLYLRGGLASHMMVSFAENPLAGAGFWTARLTAVKVIGKFLWLFLWPAHLSADYSFNAVPLFGSGTSPWEDAKTLLALAVCLGAGLLAVAVAVRRRGAGKPVAFFLIFFFIALVPTSNLIFVIGSIMAERFLYLPSVGLAGCTVAAIHALSRRHPLKWWVSPRVAWATVAALVCLALASRTYARNFDWRDERTLWSSAVEVCPESAKAHYNLGAALAQIPGQLPEAIAEYEAALRIRPDYGAAHYNLGNALARSPGQEPRAIAHYQAALRSEPNLAEGHYSLGNALSHMPGRLPDAVVEYQAALRLRPDYADARLNLGIALARIPGRLTEAVPEFEAALRLRPDSADAHNDLGSVLAQIPGRLPDAVAEYQAAIRIDPNHLNAHANLGDALAQIPGRRQEAIAEYQAALRIGPDPEVQQTLDRLRAGQTAGNLGR